MYVCMYDDLRSHFNSRADGTFGLSDDAIVHLHGIGGLTVASLRQDLGVVSSLSPQVVIPPSCYQVVPPSCYIFVAFWNPFLMSFVGIIGVLTTLRFTLICPMGFM